GAAQRFRTLGRLPYLIGTSNHEGRARGASRRTCGAARPASLARTGAASWRGVDTDESREDLGARAAMGPVGGGSGRGRGHAVRDRTGSGRAGGRGTGDGGDAGAGDRAGAGAVS